MWMTYTLYSKVLEAEETINILMPHPHQVTTGAYTKPDLYENRRKLPVLIAMGDEGTESNWWVRHSFAEGDIQTKVAAIVCVRGMPATQKGISFLEKELPILLCAQFPMDATRIAFLGWERSSIFAELIKGKQYRFLITGEHTDCVKAMQGALTRLIEEE